MQRIQRIGNIQRLGVSSTAQNIRSKVLKIIDVQALLFDKKSGLTSTHVIDAKGDRDGVIYDGRCYKLNGSTELVSYGSRGAITQFEIYIRLNLDNQVIGTLSGNGVGSISVVSGVLTFGMAMTVSNIKIDDVAKTASEAGAILNDNEFHKLNFDLVSFIAGDVEIGTDGSDFGDINYYGFKLNDGTTLFAKCDEIAGSISFCSASKDTENGVITTTTSETVHVLDNDVDYSYLNQVGYSDGVQIIPNASAFFETDGTDYYSTVRAALSYNSAGKFMRVTNNDSSTFGFFKAVILESGDRYKVTFKAKSDDITGVGFQSIGNNADIGTVISNPNITSDWQEYEFDIVATQANMRFYLQSGANVGEYFDIDDIIVLDMSNGGTTPRDESNPTHDVLGKTLDHVGRVKLSPKLVGSNCATPDGSNDYAQINYDLTGLSITSYEGTATPTIDTVNDRITFTSGTFYNLVLSDGNEFPICEGGGTKSECVTDDDKHITWVNVTESSFWLSRQNSFHYNANYGCSIITHSTNPTKYIPYQKNGTPTHYIMAIGETKTEAPAGTWNNGAETKIQYEAIPPSIRNNSFFFTGTTRESRGYADIVANYNNDDTTFTDITVDNEYKNMVVANEALTGSDLATIEKFTNQN